MLARVKAEFPRLTEPTARAIARTGISPNALTVIGVLVNGAAAAAIASGLMAWGGLLILAAGVFDLLDGALARVTQRSTAFGALLDSTLDRFSEAVFFFGLLIWYHNQQHLLGTVLVYAALVSSFLVSYVRARAEGLGIPGEVGLFSRTVRILVLAVGLIINQALIALAILALLTPITVVQRALYVWQKTRRSDNRLS
ncbi:MAG: CDP-alcohol phosphatidyltransferase family protein [Chloroflexi bacterium]|nr:CDP-alcohol phosphatidyltransferase family protein [Chloroflexota bacterium]